MKKIVIALNVSCVNAHAEDRPHTVTVDFDENTLKNIIASQAALSSVQNSVSIKLSDFSPKWFYDIADNQDARNLFDETPTSSDVVYPSLVITSTQVWWECEPKHCGEAYKVTSTALDTADLKAHLERKEDYLDVN